ncbi:uncharacterized protein LOC133888352 [Phragmites australis]|uniref:uncharacterized protein LOC133888352 n=1 Tax=Phragmites australis TaxID=29695 RepID=UPI002D77F6C8|nr:uncharacterized protein LOC133888352 [Phragmites australis]
MEYGLLVALLNEWAVQILVLFSFGLQVFLLLFAWIRRHNVSPVPRLLLWMAYQLADSTALFTLGHLSISSRLQNHHLVAFWAPFLLVHLGGQDTITAYSSEDNGIWLRHLQTLIVQVLGAAYVLYKYIPGSETLVIVAAVLIFVVGILKYGERIWALKCASMDSIWSSLDKSDASIRDEENDKLLRELLERRDCLDAEEVLMAAHGLLDVCKGLFIGLRRVQRGCMHEVMESFKLCGYLDKLMEMELSLMYDIMYTKAAVIHTWYGCCIRVIAPVATLAAFLLFQISSKEGHNRHDVTISYILLVGAVVLEMASLVRAIGSTWTRAWLYDKKWHRLHDQLVALRQLFRASKHRKWSGSVGQYNLLLSCARDKGEPAGKTMARLPGLGLIGDWWSKLRHSQSQSVRVSGSTKELVLRELLRIVGQSKEIGSFPGLLTLQHFNLDDLISWSIQDIGFEDSIIAWHVASEICLFKDRSNKEKLLEAIKVLSNYMMFLLVERPYMLPGPVRRSRYLQVRDDLCGMMRGTTGADHTAPEKRVEWALRTGLRVLVNSFDAPADYDTGVRLADVLYHQPRKLEVIFGVWVEMLCYVADHCSRESHARQLSSGGELVTIVWLMARHANLSYSSTA